MKTIIGFLRGLGDYFHRAYPSIIVFGVVVISINLLCDYENNQVKVSKIALKDLVENQFPKMTASQLDSLAGGSKPDEYSVWLGTKFYVGTRWFRMMSISWESAGKGKKKGFVDVFVYHTPFDAVRDNYDARMYTYLVVKN